MNTKSIIPGTLVEGSIINNNTSTDDIKQLKAQLQDMQMEIDILKGTINVLKKDPGIDQRALCNRGIIGGCLFVYKIKIYTVFNSSQKMIFWNRVCQVFCVSFKKIFWGGSPPHSYIAKLLKINSLKHSL